MWKFTGYTLYGPHELGGRSVGLGEHGYVELAEDRVVLKEQLSFFKKLVEESPLRAESRLYEEYPCKINTALKTAVERCGGDG